MFKYSFLQKDRKQESHLDWQFDEIGISDETSFTTLHMNIFDKGSSHHTVGDSLDHNLSKIKTKYKQGISSTSLDDLCNNWKLPLPNYLKIDMDGIEFKIISKSKKLLSDKKLK